MPIPSSRTVEDFFDKEYLGYAMYVVEGRAIPSLVDGFKVSQRKIAAAANKLWKNGGKPMKVFQLGGQAAALTFYHHGSLDQTIIGMTQEFKNSLSIFQGIGQFGSLRSPEAGAPRYIGVKFNDNFRLLYKDFDLVTPQYEEGEEIEPEFFLPIIPTVLLNGGSGIAVGFATNILNRRPVDLVDACVGALKTGEARSPLPPWVNGFHGSVELLKGTDKTWVFRGAFEVKNTSTVEITEIPPSFTYEKYEAHLEALIEKSILVSYEDSSSDRVHYTLKFARQTLADYIKRDKLGDLLKMREQETENITTLDENGKLKIFDKAGDLVDYFVKFRLGYYVKRKAQILEDLAKDILMLEAKAAFIAAITSGTIIVAGTKKAALVASITDLGIKKHDGSYDFLLSMPVYTLTQEKHAELLKKLDETRKERVKVESTPPEESYLSDLAELRKELVKKSGGSSTAPPPAPKEREKKVAPKAEEKPPIAPSPAPALKEKPVPAKEFDILAYFR